MPAAAHTPPEHLPKPSIARIWRGRVNRERADEYEAYNFETGVRRLFRRLSVSSVFETIAERRPSP